MRPFLESHCRLALRCVGLSHAARRREAIQIDGRHGLTLAEGTIDRVGRDHLDLALHARDEFRRDGALRGFRIVPFDAIQLVRAARGGLEDI